MSDALAANRVSQRTETLDRLASWTIPTAEQTVTERDCMLYGLSVGLGSRPIDAGHLKYVSEVRTSVIPTMVLSLAAPGFWFKTPELGLNWAELVNVEQSVRIHRLPDPPERLHSRSEIISIDDKGKGKGALVVWRRDLLDAATGDPCASVTSTVLLRGDGSARRVIREGRADHVTGPVPVRKPDRLVEVQTNANSGLLYRLNGTFNPLHADPAVAQAAGFARPIMPGTASLGFACAVLLEHCCAFQAERLAAIGARLTAPVYPGDLLLHELWVDGNTVAFRVSVPERNAIVLDQGQAELQGSAT